MSMIGWPGSDAAQIGALRANPSLVRHLVWVVEGDRWKAVFDDLIERAPPERRAQLEQSQQVGAKPRPVRSWLRASPKLVPRSRLWERLRNRSISRKSCTCFTI